MSINEILSINVPYPPELTVEEILSRRTDERLGSRAPNSFFIYRLAYIKEFKKRIGESISMTKISPYVSLSWSKEPPEIKEAYKRLSNWVEHRLIEMRQKNQNNPLVFIHHENSSLPQPPVNDDIIGIVDEQALFDYFYYYYYYLYYYHYINYYKPFQ